MRTYVVAIAMLLLAVLTGCSKNNAVSPVAPPATGSVQIMLTDAPASYEAVDLTISEVSVHTSAGWQVLTNKTSTVDLTALNNGTFTTLAEGAAPAGSYDQVRLKVAAGSTVVVGGVAYPLVVPAELQSGIVLAGSFDVGSGTMVSLQMDFDASKSIQPNGAGGYTLNPVIRMLPASEAGAITGHVVPTSSKVSIQVSQSDSGDPVTSTWARSDGCFTVPVLPAGWYTVTVSSSSRPGSMLEDVQVKAGQTTSVGYLAVGS